MRRIRNLSFLVLVTVTLLGLPAISAARPQNPCSGQPECNSANYCRQSGCFCDDPEGGTCLPIPSR
jgi:hypothetical protein